MPKIALTSVAYFNTSYMLNLKVQIGCTWKPSATPC